MAPHLRTVLVAGALCLFLVGSAQAAQTSVVHRGSVLPLSPVQSCAEGTLWQGPEGALYDFPVQLSPADKGATIMLHVPVDTPVGLYHPVTVPSAKAIDCPLLPLAVVFNPYHPEDAAWTCDDDSGGSLLELPTTAAMTEYIIIVALSTLGDLPPELRQDPSYVGVHLEPEALYLAGPAKLAMDALVTELLGAKPADVAEAECWGFTGRFIAMMRALGVPTEATTGAGGWCESAPVEMFGDTIREQFGR